MAPKCSKVVSPKAKATATKKKAGKATFARLDTWTRGVIWGMHLADLGREKMLEHVSKTDGSPLLLHTLDDVIAKKKKQPEWRGEDSVAGGRPHELSAEEQKNLVSLVFRERGSARVTIAYCKKRLPFLRRVANNTVSDALLAAGLKWLARRMKWTVPPRHVEMRIVYAQGVLKKHKATLDRWAYTDGTSFYLARTFDEKDQKTRASLGRHVYRMANGSDGLFHSNIGPSLYAKAQGLPVKIWGFFANGQLHYWVLPIDADLKKNTTHMNTQRYHDLVNSKFASWRRACFGDDAPCHLVQDHEEVLVGTHQHRSFKEIRMSCCR